ncbi:hypothetical protein BKA57DRAFT_435865 [Linnemannia elongata]|nr:hypothetical protein BKA57DRAFT_435865 [Linnemannia elongata]
MASSHRPPVLFQSDDDDHHHHRHQHHDNNDHSHHPFGDGHTADPRSTGLLGHQHNDLLQGQGSTHSHSHADGRGHSQERGHAHLYDELENLDDPPPHVHSQACLDSCPVQDTYTETSFCRFSKGARTNLYGLVVVKELGQVTTSSATRSTAPSSGIAPLDLPTQDSQPSSISLPETEPPLSTEAARESGLAPDAGRIRSKSSIFTETGDSTYRHLPGRYVLVAAGGTVKIFLGLQDTFEFTLGPSEYSPPQGTGTENEGAGGGGNVATAPAPNLEIVSMDAFERKDERGCQLVLVVSIAKAEDPAQFELRFYGVNTFAPSIRELLLQLPFPLTWAPTKIIHSPLEDDPFEMVVLVGGGDSRVHLFVQDAQDILPSDGIFKEQPVETLFSVLASFPYCEYCVLSLVIKDYPTCRVVAAGTQNGTLNVGIIPRDPVTFQLDRVNAKAHTVVLFSPITTLTVYTTRVQTERRRRQQQQHQQTEQTDQDDDFEEEKEDGIHLLVTCAIEQAWVYSDIGKHGLSRRADLAECSYHDSILAAHAMDADWDGQNEVLIGTYGRQLMIFKQLPPGQEPYSKSSNVIHQKQPQQPSLQHHHLLNHQYHNNQRSSSNSSSTQQLQRQLRNSFQIQQQLQLQQLQQQQMLQQQQLQQQQHQQQINLSGPTVSSPSAIGDGGNGVSLTPQWGMTWNRRFASPIYGISSADLNDDGLEELIITTINGVSFFLPDPRTAKRRLAQAVERMREIKEMREILEQLRRDNHKLVEDRRVKEEKEKEEEESRREEAEEERQRKENEAEEEAERREKEILGLEELERKKVEEPEKKKEKKKKAFEEQRLQEKEHREQGELDKVSSNEPDHEGPETEEKGEGVLVAAAVEGVEEQVPEAESKIQNDDGVGASQVVDADFTMITGVEEDEEKGSDATESVVVVESDSKDENGEKSEEVLEELAEVHDESPDQDSSEQEAPGEESTNQYIAREDSTNLERHRSAHHLLPQSLENADDEHKPGNASGSESKQAKE